MEKKKEQRRLKMAFLIITGMIVVVGILAFVFMSSQQYKIVDGYGCSKHQTEIISLCIDENNCDVLTQCMDYYDENEGLGIEYLPNIPRDDISNRSRYEEL